MMRTILIRCLLLLGLLALAGCASTATPTSQTSATARSTSQATATATPAAPSCATQPTATAEAWYPYLAPPDYAHGQLMGTINNGPVMTLSTFQFPLNVPGGNYSKAIAPGYMVWSPDARYLAVSMPVQVPTGSSYPRDVSYPYLVDTMTHVTTLISVASDTNAWNSGRSLAWADDHTLLLFYGGNTMNGSPGATYSYDVTTQALNVLPGVEHAAEGVVHCSTLYYLELTPLTQKVAEVNGTGFYRGSALLHRYDLVTQHEIGQPVTLGATYAEQGGPGYPYTPAWDVSSDGTHIVYQQTDTTSTPSFITRQFLVANGDGSNPTPIFSATLRYMPEFATLAFAPDGQSVAMIGDQNDATCYTSNLDGSMFRKYGGNHMIALYTAESPAWLPDSSGFDLVTALPAGQTFGDPFISRFLLTTPPSSDGLVPGTTQVPEAQDVAILS